MKKMHLKSNSGGFTMLLITVLFVAISMTLLIGASSPIIKQAQLSREFESSKKSYYAADGGGEDAFYRLSNGIPIVFPLSQNLLGSQVNLSLAQIDATESEITSQGINNNNYRTLLKTATLLDGFSFHYGIQTGVGGLYLYNNSQVNGNVYSSGQVLGGNTSPNSYNFINGSVVSAGPTGSVRYINASSSVHSHNILNTTVGTDAYYQSISNTTVNGASFPGSNDQPLIDFPISDEQIAEWEAQAEAGGVINCVNGSYNISAGTVTIGNRKIPCNVNITGNGTTLVLTGPLWITGDLSLAGSGGNGVRLRVADTVGNKSVVVIADNLAAKASSGRITIANNTTFYGSTNNTDSYVLLISGNNSAETGGTNVAIDVINGAIGNLLVYASHGEIQLHNNVNLREVTAWKLSLFNNTVVNYQIGLSQPLFTSGPGGTWKLKRWREI